MRLRYPLTPIKECLNCGNKMRGGGFKRGGGGGGVVRGRAKGVGESGLFIV